MGKGKSGARKPPAKPKQRRKRQIDAEHETGSPSGVDTRHALFTAISTRGCALTFADSLLIFSRSTKAKVAGWSPASSISDSELMFDSPLSDFSSSNFSAAEAVIENLTGGSKNPCRSPPAEVFWLRQMIIRPSLGLVFSELSPKATFLVSLSS